MIKRCKICHKLTDNKNSLCDLCISKLESDKIDSYFSRCPICFYPLISDEYQCENCQKENHLKVFSICDYKSVFTREILERLKFYHDRTMISVVAEQFYSTFSQLKIDLKNSIIIPVPCSKRSLHSRGWDHMEEMAKYLMRKYKIPYVKLIENVKILNSQQKELSKEQRIEQSLGKYRLITKNKKRISNFSNLILIDDVITTGSTIRECTKLLTNEFEKNFQILTLFIEL